MANSSERPRQGDQIELDRLQWGRLADWGQLVRLPTVFTLISGSLAAAIVVGSGWLPWTGLVPTVLASIAAYWAGMILNDVVDLEEDRRTRPKRPLAAGRISPALAGHVATILLLLCPILILSVTALHTVQPLWQGAAFLSAVCLSLCVRAYDSSLKETFIGPVLMASCRALNILMVGCTMLSLGTTPEFPPVLGYFAGGIGLYVLGITVFARNEDRNAEDTGNLVLGLLLQIAGIITLAVLPRWELEPTFQYLDPNRGYPLLIVLIGLTVGNRGVQAIRQPAARNVQLAVKHALLTLILIDAAVVLMWAGPYFAGVIALMLLPAVYSALTIRST
ncbi:MAG: UbiA family prenyltransferase [Planctomycetota bacterium]